MIRFLFILSVFVIPLNDFYPLLPLGEMKNEMSAYFFMTTMLFVLASYFTSSDKLVPKDLIDVSISQPLVKMAIVMFIIVGMSFVVNFHGMFGMSYHGRFPIDKFITSTAILVYGFALAYLSYTLSKIYSWHEIVIRPVVLSIGFCSFIAFFEVLAWTGGGFKSFYVELTKIFHLGFDFTGGEAGVTIADWLLPGRARSVCFEPPSLANFAGFAWPWAYAATFTGPPKNKSNYRIIWFLCTVLVLLANSRTSYVLLLGNIVALFLLKNVYLPAVPKRAMVRRGTSFILIMMTLCSIVLFFMNTDAIVSHVLRGDSVSNLTRFAAIMAAFNMFQHSPAWGYGFGQFGFHIVDNMPTWGYYSWEIRNWFVDNIVIWPPVYSIYARFAAELGILGIIAWVAIWVLLARTVWRLTYAYQIRSGKLLHISYPIIMSCYSALLAGIALDSLRTPMMWISMGLACSYIYDVRLKLKKLNNQTSSYNSTTSASQPG